MKSTQTEQDFHERVLAGDPVAFSQLCDWLYAGLVRSTGLRARNHYAYVDPALVEEAVGQALLAYNDQPGAYDPERMPLQAYLAMSAYNDYRNLSSKERRHSARRANITGEDDTELEIADGKQDLEALITRISVQEWWPHVRDALNDPHDMQLLVLLVNGVRSTESYARVLGLGELPQDEQAREVKRVKDRIAKRLRRLGEAYDEQL